MKKGTSKTKEKPELAKKPKQGRLAGMEDSRLDDLHSLAEDYVEIRDERIALNIKEKPLKDKLLAAMKKYGKTHYHHNGLDIEVVHESEKVKVRLKKEGEDDTPF